MNVIRIDCNNQVNGAGLRVVLWLAGCDHRCPFCQNPETWDPKAGHPFSADDQAILAKQLAKKEISGITLSGGEATFPGNREEATALMKWVKEAYPDKTIWVYTGYAYEEIQNLPMMSYIDVLVDGPYIQDLNPGSSKLHWRGSANQRVIDVPATRKSGQITWVKDFMGRYLNETENVDPSLLQEVRVDCHR